VTVRNTGAIVEEFDLTVLGEPARWADVVPPTVKLFPGDEAQVQVWFRPPRLASTEPGLIPFGVSVRPRDPDALGIAEEGIIEVGQFADIDAELLPRNSTGRLRGRHALSLSNNGNGHVEAEVTATDADDLLRFSYSHELLRLPAGTAGYSRIKAKPRKRLWWGQPKTIPFNVFIDPGDGMPPTTLDAGVVQLPLIPRWTPRALMALAALALAWLLLLKPAAEKQIAKAATEALDEQKAEATPTAVPEATPEASPESPAGQGDGSAGDEEPKPKPAPKPVAVDGRLEIGGTEEFTVPKGKTLAITDLFFETSSSRGTVQLKRDDDVLHNLVLRDFRYIDYHFVTPISLKAGQKLRLVCTKEPCGKAALSYSAQTSKVAKKQAT
jgi:hypothetical protein